MPKKISLKTSQNKKSVTAFINAIGDAQLRQDCKTLLTLFTEVTGTKPKMWGDSIIGFGSYVYHRSNGAEGEFMATGFSPRKSGPTVYIMPGYQDYRALLKKLGPHTLGKSCLYLKSLDEIDLHVLKHIIKKGIVDLKKTHTVTMQ